LKQAFKEIHPLLKNDGEKKKKLAKIIIDYERDIHDYVDNWKNQKLYEKK
jgi:hypothetical protein